MLNYSKVFVRIKKDTYICSVIKIRNFNCTAKIVRKYVSAGEFSEIQKVINSVKK